MVHSLFMIIVIAAIQYLHSIKDYDLPIFPKDIQHPFDVNERLDQNHSFRYNIPRDVWIAVRNSSNELPKHTAPLMSRNKDWTFHFCGNEEKDAFMETHYANTSILWTYNILNPIIGCSKPEIWRLAMLYKMGGIYIDDDSTIESPFDDVIESTDRFIVGKEGYDFDDRCYREDFPLSNHSINMRFGKKANRQDLLGGAINPFHRFL